MEKHDLKLIPKAAYVVKAEFEKRGVEFVESTSKFGPGVRWKRPGEIDPFQAKQIRTARALLGLSQQKLAELSGLERLFILRLEKERRKSVDLAEIEKLVRSLELAGVAFIAESERSGAGVRLREPSSAN